MGNVAAVREAFAQLWGRMGPFWGVAPATARVYGWLLSLPDGATAERMVAELGMSRGAVSMACRELRDWGLVHDTKEPGSRQITYRPEPDLEKAIRNIVQTRKRREWDPILEHLRTWIGELESERSQEAALFRQRLEAIEALVGLADSMAESFLKGGLVQKLGLKALVGAARDKQRKRKRKQDAS
jgi:DNA-binding transcriptional regulator GbsR (MarR family)